MRRMLLVSLGLLAVLAALVMGAFALAGPRFLAPRLEAAASRAFGRPVTIEGALALRWSPPLSIRIEGVRIGPADGAEAPELAHIRHLEVRPALWPLLRGAIELEEVDLADATIRPGFASRNRAEEPPEPGSGLGSVARGTLVPRIAAVRGARLRLELPRPNGGPPLRLEIARLEASLPDPAGRLDLEASGSLEGVPWTLRLGLASPSALLQREAVRIEPFAVRLGEDDLEGRLALDLGGPRPRLSGELESRRMAPLRLAALVRGEPAPDPPRHEAGPARELIPERPLEVAALQGLELALALAVAELHLDGLVVRELRAPLTLANARLALPLQARLAGGTVEGRLALDAGAPEPSLELDVKLHGVAVAELQRALAQPVSVEAPLDLALALTGHGRTSKALLASLDGRLTAALGRGRIALAALDRLAGGVRELVAELAGERRGEWVPLRCAVADLPVRAGVLETRTAVLETEAARLVADGRVDLARERLDLLLVPRSRAATVALVVPVRVRGTFAQPRFALDEREAARRAALGLLGALVFPPAVLAAFADLGVSDNPCLSPTTGAGQEPAKGPPALPGAEILRRGLEGLFGR